jgi:hypothetical protein
MKRASKFQCAAQPITKVSSALSVAVYAFGPIGGKLISRPAARIQMAEANKNRASMFSRTDPKNHA